MIISWAWWLTGGRPTIHYAGSWVQRGASIPPRKSVASLTSTHELNCQVIDSEKAKKKVPFRVMTATLWRAVVKIKEYIDRHTHTHIQKGPLALTRLFPSLNSWCFFFFLIGVLFNFSAESYTSQFWGLTITYGECILQTTRRRTSVLLCGVSCQENAIS